jgi:hypothetical protein
LKNRKLIGFILAIALGLAAGLFYGWLVNPGQVRNTTLSSLRSDYQADYVLMVAEAYPLQEDTAEAIILLQQLDKKDPVVVVQKALITAQQLGYSQIDLQSMADLEKRLVEGGGGQ